MLSVLLKLAKLVFDNNTAHASKQGIDEGKGKNRMSQADMWLRFQGPISNQTVQHRWGQIMIFESLFSRGSFQILDSDFTCALPVFDRIGLRRAARST